MNIIRRLKKHKLNNKGMSLVEVVVAVAVFTVVALPTMQIFASSANTNYDSRLRQRATTVGESVMESFKAYDMESLCKQFRGQTFGGVTTTGSSYMEVIALVNATFDGSYWVGGSYTAPNDVFCPDDTLKPEASVFHFAASDVVSEGQHYDVEVVAQLNSHPEVIRMDSPNAYSDAIIKLGSDFNTTIRNNMISTAKARFLAAKSERNESEIKDVEFSNFKRTFTITVSDVSGVQKVILKVKCAADANVSYQYANNGTLVSGNYPVSSADMEYDVLLPDDTSTETEWLVYDNSATIANVVVDGSRQCKLNQIYLYYCPAYEVFFGSGAEDEIVVDASLSSLYDPSVSQYPEATGHTPLRVNVTKQLYTGILDSQLNLQEFGYSAKVTGNIAGGGEAILISNLDKNISGVASPSVMTPPTISGFMDTKTYENGFKDEVKLEYDIVVHVFDHDTGEEVATFSGSTNE